MMRKRNIIIVISVYVVGAMFFTNGIMSVIKNECQKAYSTGYYAGFASKICNLAFDYYEDRTKDKFEYVGVGNENYDIYPYSKNMSGDLNRRRGRKFWWSE